MLEGVHLDNVRFHEALHGPPSAGYFIGLEDVTTSKVTVDGPSVKWGSASGLYGSIPDSPDS